MIEGNEKYRVSYREYKRVSTTDRIELETALDPT